MQSAKKLYIETVGCQMNVLDSELVVASLRKEGYTLVDSPRAADTILFNTCSVRQHAEDKIYSALGRLRGFKQQNPDKIIGVLGCMAQKDQQLIFERAGFVDLVVGPGQLHQIPQLLRDIAAGSGPKMEVSLDRTAGSRDEIADSFESYDPQRDPALREPALRPTPFQAYVRVMIGCDKFCTYCIVPKVRGPEQSRPPQQIVAEVRQLVDAGCKEITLLGQTVNSYKYGDNGRTVRLSDLLYRLHDIEGLARIKFVTNFPKDMTQDLLQAVRDLKKCCRYLHVPVQSGSNAVLQRMKRGYTVEEYREMLVRIRATIPDAAVTSDFIVGFCGETEDDFQQSVRLVEESRFKNSFIFKYSPRDGTKAFDRFADDVPDDAKRRRNNELLAVQSRISAEDNRPFVGCDLEILVEGPSKKAQKRGEGHSANPDGGRSEGGQRDGHLDGGQAGGGQPDDRQLEDGGDVLQLTGRTMCDRIVVFVGNRRQIGQLVPVRIYDASPFTLFGMVVTQHVGPEVYSIADLVPAPAAEGEV
ncbi:MAG: tRNA (N6-isopentenyl adenosine(37)-C2)-methylthiotransferase MiaB [Planctomycetia bacterium]|nr:tRNA (N6-isopentenyl adenosine(37)-C2)-methylthiotransferase MiaB [Planctomycetia bacterium]